MRLLAVGALLVLTLPVAVAGPSEQGATVGLNLGVTSVGVWDAWQFDHVGGTATLGLSWAPSLFPGADYDLHLYTGDALDDNALTQDELIAKSQTRTFAAHVESIVRTLPAGRYYVAVMPWQTQAETYTLTANAGHLNYAAAAPGFCSGCY